MQENVLHLIKEIFGSNPPIHCIFSNPRQSQGPRKIEIKPILVKGKPVFQVSEFVQTKVLHHNLNGQDCLDFCIAQLEGFFKQAVIFTVEADYHFLINKKGNITTLKKAPTRSKGLTAHNRSKCYLLPEGEALPFLVELGVMKADGSIVPKKRDKFRQINRFLEMVQDVLCDLPQGRPLTIVDFGCGKAYLTFALYYLLHHLKGWEVNITGLDLKADVMQDCQQLADRLGYEGLRFCVGDSTHYHTDQHVDMVVALHACDIATDIALEKAIKWKSSVILSAPCCQHELYKQVKSEPLHGILEYGILKERFAALATDAARAQILEMMGYKTQVLEFIDPEHTPKNLLIRAVHGNKPEARLRATKQFKNLKEFLQITPYLERCLRD